MGRYVEHVMTGLGCRRGRDGTWGGAEDVRLLSIGCGTGLGTFTMWQGMPRVLFSALGSLRSNRFLLACS